MSTYKESLIPPMLQELLEKYLCMCMWVCLCKCKCVFLSMFCSIFLPQNCKHEGIKTWDDLTCLKNANEMNVFQITLLDNWDRVKICINTVTIGQLLDDNLSCYSSFMLSTKLKYPFSISYSHDRQTNTWFLKLEEIFIHICEGHCKMRIFLTCVMLKGEYFVPIKCYDWDLHEWMSSNYPYREKKIWP